MNKLSTLEKLGYDSSIDGLRVEYGAEIDQIARVTAEHKGVYEVASVAGEYRATVTGKRMLTASSRSDYPAVGDWVVIKDDASDAKIIEDILSRRTMLRKKYGGKDEAQLIAANVDVVFVVESIDRDYNLNRFERYLVLARQGGIRPVIILNKSDLMVDADLKGRIEQIHERFGDIEVLSTSTVSDAGVDLLKAYIKKGLTYGFLGSSGAGKSSLINKLLDQDIIETKSIGEKSGRGVHTTTARQMYFTSSGSIIIDNPGSREVGVVDANTGVEEVFAGIEDIASTCRFTNCKHVKEPGCAVVQALKNGVINAAQYENYQKLRKETAHYELSAYGKRQKDKKFGKFVKNAKNELKNYMPD